MSKIFITGSSDGLGSLAAQALIKRGHQVYVHGRNPQRASDAEAACKGKAAGSFSADLSSIEATKALASELNAKGPWDAILHNAGVMRTSSSSKGPEGLPILFATNVVAPYILTCLVQPPKRLVFLSSSMHMSGDSSLRDLQGCNYSTSKLYNTMLAFAFAKRFPDTAVNSLDPGWVATKMGGASAPDSPEAAADSYCMLAEGTGAAKGATGKHFYHDREKSFQKAAADGSLQDKLLEELESISGVSIPKQG